MSVSKLFWQDPYATTLEARIQTLDGSVITLDRTIFFAFSGGQASDSGTIGGRHVLEARKDGLEIFYTLDSAAGLAAGDSVLVAIDGARRLRLMRLHFAAELVLELVNQLFDRPEKLGANISADKARLDFSWSGNITSILPLLSEKLDLMIAADHEIVSSFRDRAAELRTWKIDGFATVDCGGTHPRRTGEVGSVHLKRGKGLGKDKERIEITLCD
ncbi:alanyl-tRNA editing protein [Azotosporobacter soli]|uniref:alanyl-tRNA editing protein n=1 Tax=Azotosporobacter soli TaxID=3055040 RepID=UPI0031FED1E5